MQLSAWVEHPDHVCCRYRLRAFQPTFERLGFRVNYRDFPKSLWQFLVEPTFHADVGIIQRRLLARFNLNRMRRSHRQLIFDFDDAVWLRDSYSPRGLASRRRARRFQAMIDVVDCVVAGNRFLADAAAQFTPPDRIAIIPTCVDPRDYEISSHESPDQIVRLVWIGSSSTLKGLERVTPILEQIGKLFPQVRLKLICDRFIQLQNSPVECCPWNQLTEARELACSDIGLAWMPDDDWSRGKCGLKVLQYMAAGLPVIANRVGVHREMVRDGDNGWLADTAAEWLEAIGALVTDVELRRRFGAAGRARVESEYSLGRGHKLWADLLAGVSLHRRDLIPLRDHRYV